MLKACLISVLVLVLNMTRAYADSKHLNMLVMLQLKFYLHQSSFLIFYLGEVPYLP